MPPTHSLLPSILTIFLLPITTLTAIYAEPNVTSLTGTWTSKSWAVYTGPDFYDPEKDRLIEPKLTGTSLSFTDDGFFEQAVYASTANPAKPSCPTALLKFQHGKYVLASNGSLILHPITDDGRQILSDPCKQKNSVYARYNSTEVYKQWEVIEDGYRKSLGIKEPYRLNMWAFDGKPMNPLYRVTTTPKMNPTTTLHPTSTPNPKKGADKKVKRSTQMQKRNLITDGEPAQLGFIENINADRFWWLGVGLTALGGFCYAAGL